MPFNADEDSDKQQGQEQGELWYNERRKEQHPEPPNFPSQINVYVAKPHRG